MAQFNNLAVGVPYVTSYKDWPTTTIRDGKKKVERSEHYPRLTVAELKGYRSNCPAAVSSLKTWGTPTYLILKNTSDVLVKKLDRGGVTSKKILADIQAAQKKLGKPVKRALYDKFNKACKAVNDALEEFELAKAVKALPALNKLKGLTGPLLEVRDKINKEVTKSGRGWIEEAQEHAEADKEEAIEKLEKLLKIFKGHELKEEIKAAIKELSE